ncbi:MAG: helix-turn-helix transcriptional regulator [Leptospirales bacterium]
MKLDQCIISRLAEIIEDSGMNKQQFARAIGLTPSSLSEIFSGRIKNLSTSLLRVLELKRGVNPEWLRTGKGAQYIMSNQVVCPYEYELVLYHRKLGFECKKGLAALCQALLIKQEEDSSR